MRAIAVDAFGQTPSLRDLPVPEPGPSEVRVRIHAAGINPFDRMVAEGALTDAFPHRFPLALGFDAAGVIDGSGADVEGLTVGDEVYGFLFTPVLGAGTYAEYTVAPAALLAPRPTAVDFAGAATLPMPGLTALAAVEAAKLGAGDRVAIVGAAGGVGSFAVQLAASAGAHVIVVARGSDEAYLRELGASEVVDHTLGGVDQALASAHPEGIHALIDVVSDAAALAGHAALLVDGGRLVSTQYAADREGLAGRGIAATNLQAAPSAEGLAELARLIDAGDLRVVLQRTWPLEEAGAAWDHSRNGQVRGRLALTVVP